MGDTFPIISDTSPAQYAKKDVRPDNTRKNAGDKTAASRPKTKLGMNIGVTILEPKPSKTKPPTGPFSFITYGGRWLLRNVDPSLMIPEDETGLLDIPRQLIMFARAVNLKPKESRKEIFNKVLDKTEHTVGAKIDYVVGYMKLYDGWDYATFPKMFCDACYENGSVPAITIEPYFKRHYVDYQNGKLVVRDFLEEYNIQITDHKSELYKNIKKIADKTAEYGKEIDIRIFHEGNLDFAYPWTMYMNGEAKAPPKYKLAWDNTYKIFKDAWTDKHGNQAKRNSSFMLCLHAFPNTEENGLLVSEWNSFESILPDKGVDEIGFDIYQEKNGYSFNMMFEEAGKFIDEIRKKHPNMPVSICEASTKPEDYRTDFVIQLFASAAKYAFKFIGWFNENKKEEDLDARIDAEIISRKSEQNIEKAKEASDVNVMRRAYGLPPIKTEAPEKSEETPKETAVKAAVNEALKAFREMVIKYTSSAVINDKIINPGAKNETPVDNYYKDLFGLETPENSYGGAISQWIRDYSRAMLKKDLEGAEILKKIGALSDKPETRLAMAKTLSKMWFALPKKYVYCEASKTVAPAISGSMGGVKFKVERLEDGSYAVYKGDTEKPSQTVFAACQLDKRQFSRNETALVRELLKKEEQGAVEYKVTKIKEDVKNGDVYAVYKSGMRQPLVVKKYSEINLPAKDMAIFKELWQEAVCYSGKINEKGEAEITDMQMALELLDKTINDKKFYGTKEYIMSLVAKQEYLLKYDTIYLNEAQKIKKGTGTELKSFEALKEAEKICFEILDILESGEYVRYGYNNPQLSREWVLGLQAEVYVSLGDIYASEGVKKYQEAKKYYDMALNAVNDKEKYRYPWQMKEKFLNNAAEIGLARAMGHIASKNAAKKGMMSLLDKNVYKLAQKTQLDKKIDPILITKATFYLAELFACYTQFISDKKHIGENELTRQEGLDRLREAYTIFQELLGSELSYRAQIQMMGNDKHGGIKKQDVSLRKME